jgi:hypothetical protein
MQTAITTPHITTRQYNNITGTSNYGVYLYAYSDNNTPYKQANNITGTYDGVYLSAYSDNNTTYNRDYTTIHRNIRLWCWSGCIQQQKYHI